MPVISCPDCSRDVSTLATACPHCGRPSPAGTTPMPAASGPSAREETLWTGTPSRILLAGHIAGIVVTLVGLPLLTQLFASMSANGDDLKWLGWIATIVIVAIQAIALTVSWLRLRSTLYTVTNQRVILETGVFSKGVDEIDMRYIDDTLFYQSFGARMLGIGNVTLMSSDKTTPNFVLRSIRDPRRIREMIRSAAYEKSHRQIFTRET
jgi:uncharacterized membrane protein YdbT with pleckstrin-like domain